MAHSIIMRGAAAMSLLFGLLVASTAQAQTYGEPAPRSPYALPTPTYRGDPDAEDVLNGNGRLHSSGQWRHWGDDRNMGETFQEIFAPNGVIGESPADIESARRERYCNMHPGRC